MKLRHMTIVLVQGMILAACGASPAFNEDVTTRSKSADASTSGDDAIRAPGSGDETEGHSDSGDDIDGSNNGGNSNDGSDDADDQTNGNGGNNQDDGDDGNGGGNGDGEGVPGSEILIEDGGTLDIPGVKAQRVGINFEDHTDFDYNDAVMCFEGNFKIEGTSVISYQNQIIEAETFSASGCDHRVDVLIVHEDGTSASFSYLSDSTETIELPFRIKSRLEVTMTTIAGSCHRNPVTMHNAQYAIVKPNVCNNSGT